MRTAIPLIHATAYGTAFVATIEIGEVALILAYGLLFAVALFEALEKIRRIWRRKLRRDADRDKMWK